MSDDNDDALTYQMNEAAWEGAWKEFLDAFNTLAALKPKQRVNHEAWSNLFNAVLAIEALSNEQPPKDDDE
jgi:hypothetical protein